MNVRAVSPTPISASLNNDKVYSLRSKLIQRYGNSYIITVPMPAMNQVEWRNVRIMIGPHYLGTLVTVGIILGGTYSNVKMLSKLKPVLAAWLSVFIAVFCTLACLFLGLTSMSDPGIVFAGANDMEENCILNLDSVPYCDVCEVYQHQRQKIAHCEDCGYCIAGLDHHCPWMGQCIGRGNMLWFVLFNLSWLLLFAEFLYTALVLVQ